MVRSRSSEKNFVLINIFTNNISFLTLRSFDNFRPISNKLNQKQIGNLFVSFFFLETNNEIKGNDLDCIISIIVCSMFCGCYFAFSFLIAFLREFFSFEFGLEVQSLHFYFILNILCDALIFFSHLYWAIPYLC